MELVGAQATPPCETDGATVVDCRGMLCAQGILRVMRAMVGVPPSGLVKVLSTDSAAEHDYPAWCRGTGHEFLGHRRGTDPRWDVLVVSLIRKRPIQART